MFFINQYTSLYVKSKSIIDIDNYRYKEDDRNRRKSVSKTRKSFLFRYDRTNDLN